MKKFENIIIASDLDGTFLADNIKEVPRNVEKIKYFIENGGTFTFATGRIGVHVMRALPNSANYVNCPIVSCNGMALFDLSRGKTVRQSLFSAELISETVDFLYERYPNAFYRIMTPVGVVYFQPENRFAIREKAENTVDYIYTEPSEINKLEIYKLTLRDTPEVLEEIKAVVEERFGDTFDICRSWSSLMELMPRGYSKAVLLSELRDELSASGVRKTLYAVGDYENDLEMLRAADVAVCPANAMDKVKAVCDLCLCDNNSGVIADLIEHIEAQMK